MGCSLEDHRVAVGLFVGILLNILTKKAAITGKRVKGLRVHGLAARFAVTTLLIMLLMAGAEPNPGPTFTTSEENHVTDRTTNASGSGNLIDTANGTANNNSQQQFDRLFTAINQLALTVSELGDKVDHFEHSQNEKSSKMSQAGSSTIDYFIVSNDLCKQELLESLVVDSSCVESDHLPVSLTLKLSPRAPKMKQETEKVRWVKKLVWDKDKVPEFLEILTSTATQAEITHARATVSTDINLAIHAFVECLKKASACMVRRIKVDETRKSAEWFDRDCFIH